MCLEKESSESKVIPRLRAEETGWIEILLGIDKIMLLALASWARFPIRRNSVLDGLRERKLADIQEETVEIVDSRADRPEAESDAENEV